jgi:hypothetical protein
MIGDGELTSGNPGSNWPRFIITGALFTLVVWSLILITDNLSTNIVRDSNGDTVDVFQRSTDVLHTVLPLLTIALGYWFGAAGRERAEKKAEVAQHKASVAEVQLGTVLASGDGASLLEKAQKAYPAAFPGLEKP